MRLRFPELKNAVNSLKKFIDDDFLEGKWGDNLEKKDLSQSTERKFSANDPVRKLLRKYQAYSPFIDDRSKKKS